MAAGRRGQGRAAEPARDERGARHSRRPCKSRIPPIRFCAMTRPGFADKMPLAIAPAGEPGCRRIARRQAMPQYAEPLVPGREHWVHKKTSEGEVKLFLWEKKHA